MGGVEEVGIRLGFSVWGWSMFWMVVGLCGSRRLGGELNWGVVGVGWGGTGLLESVGGGVNVVGGKVDNGFWLFGRVVEGGNSRGLGELKWGTTGWGWGGTFSMEGVGGGIKVLDREWVCTSKGLDTGELRGGFSELEREIGVAQGGFPLKGLNIET